MKMPFGKHFGESIDELSSSYLKWVLEECTGIKEDLWNAINEELEARHEENKKN